MDPTEIRSLLEQAFPGARVGVAGDGRHFQALVVSEAFAGKDLLERHRMVYAALGERMGQIHALSIRARTPEETG